MKKTMVPMREKGTYQKFILRSYDGLGNVTESKVYTRMEEDDGSYAWYTYDGSCLSLERDKIKVALLEETYQNES